MFFATFVTVGVTGWGVWLINRTLKETRRAAVSAEGIPKEAAQTTEAAVQAAAEARRQSDIAALSMLRLERPYLLPKIVRPDHKRDGQSLMAFLRYCFINHGRTPAVLRPVFARLESATGLPLRLTFAVKTDVYEIVSPGTATTERRVDAKTSVSSEPWGDIEATKMIFYGSIIYVDMAGAP